METYRYFARMRPRLKFYPGIQEFHEIDVLESAFDTLRIQSQDDDVPIRVMHASEFMDFEEEEDNLAKASPLSVETIVKFVCDNHPSQIESEFEKKEEKEDLAKQQEALRGVMTLEKYLNQIGEDFSSISMGRLHLRIWEDIKKQWNRPRIVMTHDF